MIQRSAAITLAALLAYQAAGVARAQDGYGQDRYGNSSSGSRYDSQYGYDNGDRYIDDPYADGGSRGGYGSPDRQFREDARYSTDRTDARRSAVERIQDEIAAGRDQMELDRRRTERLRAQARSERESEDLRLAFENRREAFERWREHKEMQRARIESSR